MSELTPQFLRVTNFERYQHYKNRRPIWIKFYIDLLDDYRLNKQKPATRLLAALLLLLAATQDNKIPHDPEWIAEKLHMTTGSVFAGIESLVSIGFLSVASGKHSASKVIAKRSKAASLEVEVEKSKKPPNPLSVKGQKQKHLAVVDTCPECFIGGKAHTADCSKREIA